MSDTGQVNAAFRTKLQQERQAIDRLAALGRKKIGAGADENIRLLLEVATKGLARVLDLRKRSLSRQSEIRELVQEFIQFGARSVLLTGSQRGGDFLNNQIRGQWAERVALSMNITGVKLVPFGPSGAAMPGEQDHRQIIMTFKEIQLLEGKRPDLLGFDSDVWDELSEGERHMAETWPLRRLDPEDVEVVKKARFGAEVKNSTWHYGKRREAGRGPLSITAKDEEVAAIQAWSETVGLPVVFFQVLFDELYCMSFRRMRTAIDRKQLYTAGDYEVDKQKSKTGVKLYHKFHLVDFRHLCARVTFPSESTAEVRTLGDGNIVPFINFQPAQATNVEIDVILREVDHVDLATPPGDPPTLGP